MISATNRSKSIGRITCRPVRRQIACRLRTNDLREQPLTIAPASQAVLFSLEDRFGFPDGNDTLSATGLRVARPLRRTFSGCRMVRFDLPRERKAYGTCESGNFFVRIGVLSNRRRRPRRADPSGHSQEQPRTTDDGFARRFSSMNVVGLSGSIRRIRGSGNNRNRKSTDRIQHIGSCRTWPKFKRFGRSTSARSHSRL